MDILEIKLNKAKLKDVAKNSLLFSVAPEELKEFCVKVDNIPENEDGAKAINELMSSFTEEKAEVIKSLSGVKETQKQIHAILDTK